MLLVGKCVRVLLGGVKGFQAVPSVWELATEKEWDASESENEHLQRFVTFDFPVLIRVLSDELIDSSYVSERDEHQVEHEEDENLREADGRVKDSADYPGVLFGTG